ncbi:unnamed protein product, partial [Allacma fusca]
KKNFQEERQDHPRKTKRPAINIDSSSDDQESLNLVPSLKNLRPLYQSSESEVDDRQHQGSPDSPSEIAIPHSSSSTSSNLNNSVPLQIHNCSRKNCS